MASATGMIGETTPRRRAELIRGARPPSSSPCPQEVSLEDAARPAARLRPRRNRMLVTRGQLVRGEKVLILGGQLAASGVACVQIAKLLGAEISGRHQLAREAARAHGARCRSRLLDYSREGVVDAVKAASTASRGSRAEAGFDVAVNFTGQRHLA